MANSISVHVHQEGGVSGPIFTTAKVVGVPNKSVRGTIMPVDHTTSASALAAIGMNGEAPDPSISEKVYACINVITPSNAGTMALFVTETVAAIITAQNA